MSPWNQLIVVNMVLAAAAVIVWFGAPLTPAITGALGAGMLLFIGPHFSPAGSPALTRPPKPRAAVIAGYWLHKY